MKGKEVVEEKCNNSGGMLESECKRSTVVLENRIVLYLGILL